MPCLYERILMLHRDTRGPKSKEARKITLELAHAMTLAHLHSTFPISLFPLELDVTCVLVPLI